MVYVLRFNFKVAGQSLPAYITFIELTIMTGTESTFTSPIKAT